MTVMTRRLIGVFAAVGLALLAACNLSNLQAPGLSHDKDEAARAVFKAVQKGDLSGIQMGAEMSTPEAQAAMPQVFAAIPKGEPSKVRLVSWSSNSTGLTGARTETLVTNHQYTFPAVTLDVETVMSRDYPAQGPVGPWKLRGFHFKPAAAAAAAPASPPAKGEAPAQTTPTDANAAPGQTGVSNDFVDQPSDDAASGQSAAASEARPVEGKGGDAGDGAGELQKPHHNN